MHTFYGIGEQSVDEHYEQKQNNNQKKKKKQMEKRMDANLICVSITFFLNHREKCSIILEQSDIGFVLNYCYLIHFLSLSLSPTSVSWPEFEITVK